VRSTDEAVGLPHRALREPEAGRPPLRRRRPLASPGVRAVQITRFGGPEVRDVVDLPDPVPGNGQEVYDVSAAGSIRRHAT